MPDCKVTSRRRHKCGLFASVNFIGRPEDMGRIVPVRITAASRTTLKGERNG